MARSLFLALALVVSSTGLVRAGAVDASYFSRMANRPVVMQHELPEGTPLPPFKVFIVRDGNCPPGELERYVGGSAELGAAPSRSCIARHG